MELLNEKLVGTRPQGKVSVWFPQQYVPSLGVGNATSYKSGAYLEFASVAEAQAHVKARTFGVVLDASGQPDATQPWGQASQMTAQLMNDKLTATRQAGKHAVWFPGYDHGERRRRRPDAVRRGWLHRVRHRRRGSGARHAAAARRRSQPDGQLDVTQPWNQATQYGLELTNVHLKDNAGAEQVQRLVPATVPGQIGVNSTTAFNDGAYLAFDTLQDAKTHCAGAWARRHLRRQGQVRPLGTDLGNRPEVPAGGGDLAAAAPCRRTRTTRFPRAPPISSASTPTRRTAGKLQIVVRTHNMQLNETLKYELYATVAGSDMKIKDLGSKSMAPGSYVFDATFDIDLKDIENTLSIVKPGTKVTSGAPFAIRVQWPTGHDQGAVGAGGRGAHKFAVP